MAQKPPDGPAGPVLTVRVADAEGRPAAGVLVQAASKYGGKSRKSQTAVTSADGCARLLGLGDDAFYALIRAAAPDGRATTWQQGHTTDGTDAEASLVLQPGALLSGVVVEAETGSPIAGAVVFANGCNTAAINVDRFDIILFDAETGRITGRLTNPFLQRITDLAFDATDDRLFGVTDRSSIHVWDLNAIDKGLQSLNLGDQTPIVR